MSKQDGGAAFPVDTGSSDGHQTGNSTWQHPGMTLRDYFAGKALTAVVGAIMPQECHRWTSANFAREAYDLADAMLAERSK